MKDLQAKITLAYDARIGILFEGETGTHRTAYDFKDDKYDCTCQGFIANKTCKHVDLCRRIVELIGREKNGNNNII